MKVVSRTHQGNVREDNEDSLLIQEGQYGLFGVADGLFLRVERREADAGMTHSL